MSNVSYDLDTSGGLMPLIRALIKPPDEEPNAQKSKKPQHPYYKRPGKGHNHDSCDACGEGGDLICCDRCPASFHYGCYDPPLDENNIPAGLWLCKECRASDAEAPTSSRSSRAQSPVDDGPRSLRNKKKSKDSNQSEAESKEDTKEKEKALEVKELTPMEVLVNAARIMNPRQFELPPEMRIVRMFPGMDKENGNGKNGGSVISVDSQGCVPLPAKACFVCANTCKMAPLLQCDYCPLLYHQDCLDPPLTALPTGRWMCPNHVEQYIDWKMVRSVSAVERVALWEQFAAPPDQHAIKVDFIRRARNKHPAFRVKVPVGIRGRVIVPGMVRYHYRRPPPLLPSRREYVRCQTALKNLQATTDIDPSDVDTSLPKQQICMNMECGMYSGGRCEHAAPTLTTLTAASRQDADEDLQAMRDKTENTDSDSLSDTDFEYLSTVKRRKVSPSQDKGKRKGVRLEFRADDDAEALLAAVDEQLEKLDERLVKLLAWQRLQQVLAGEGMAGRWRRVALGARAAAAVARSVDRAKLAKYGFRHVALPSDLLTQDERERISRAVWGPVRSESPPPPLSPPHSLSDCIVRATLCAVLRPNSDGLGDGLGRPIPMRLSRLSVGAAGACDVQLPTYCRRAAPTHAVIFYDEVTRHFELINYSEWGTRVNGVLYCSDATLAAPHPQHDIGERVRGGDGNTSCSPRIKGALRPRAGSPPSPVGCRCSAPSPAPPAGAWEGSALVPHGALLQFGCLMYVFSIADHCLAHDDHEYEI